jgi:pyridoxamine 5'-phosphate oxidase
MTTERYWESGQQYSGPRIDPSTAAPDPFEQFRAWMAAAVAAKLPHPNAMTLATVDDRGRPAARIVLMKELDDRGLTFFTNYQSNKGKELAHLGFAALVFYWASLHRQVRVEGAVEKVSAAESDAYFSARPRGSQLSAIASPQSSVVPGRELLEDAVRQADARFTSVSPERPPHWGGYRLVPDAFEFWQGQESRLHDRVRYRRADGDVVGSWLRERLAP